MAEEKDDQDRTVRLEWKDYVAIVIASLETTLLPFLVVIAILVVLLFIFLH